MVTRVNRAIRQILPIAVLLLFGSVSASGDITITNAAYTLRVCDEGRLAIIEVATAEYVNWQTGGVATADMQIMSGRILDHFTDAFDFILLIDNEDALLTPYHGKHFGVQNGVTGIGKSIFNSTASYGSAGKLQSVVHLGKVSGIRDGPSLHEMLHRWANSLSDIPSPESPSHWGFSSVGGQLGGWKPGTLVSLGGGVYDADGPTGHSSFGLNANGGNSLDYAELELYLMGMISTNEISNTILVAQSPSTVSSSAGQFSASGFTVLSISDIVNTEGARSPSFAAAQKSFRVLAAIVTDSELSASRKQAISDDIAAIALPGDDGVSARFNFWEATRGRGTITMDGLHSLLQAGNDYVSVIETAELELSGPEGGPFSATNVSYTLTNTFASTITWTAQVGQAWLEVAPASGTLTAGAIQQVTVSIGSSADVLPPGTHSTTISFRNTANGAATTRDAQLFVKGFASPPFRDGFESADLSPYWLLSGSETYNTYVSPSHSPHAGSYHLVMDDSTGDTTYSRNTALLRLDLQDRTNAILSFWIMEDGDEAHGPPASPFTGDPDYDGVSISADGTNWYLAMNLWGYDASYVEQTLDLDAVAASNALSFSDRFYLRFDHYDNYPMGSADGFALDSVNVTADWLTGNGAIVVAERQDFDATGRPGGPFAPSSKVYTISNDSPFAVTWTASVASAWLAVSPAEGTLAPLSAASVTASITTNAESFAPGTYIDSIEFINTSNLITTVRDATLSVETFAQMPFSETFESGSLSNYWITSGSAEYRTLITSNFLPYAGTYHLTMDDNTSRGAISRNDNTLGVNLLGYTNVTLTFWAKDYGDEPHPSSGGLPTPFTSTPAYDGVAISTDGRTWYPIVDLRTLTDTNYTQIIVNLDDAALSNTLWYTATFGIRFSQYDNFGMSTDLTSSDGICLDNISVTGTLLDSDADGIPDYFEQQHGLSTTNPADAALDSDGDSVSNLDEYRAATSPTNILSVLEILSVDISSNQLISIDDTSIDRTYDLMYSTNLLAGEWTRTVSNIVGTGSSLQMSDTNGLDRVFYRIEVNAP